MILDWEIGRHAPVVFWELPVQDSEFVPPEELNSVAVRMGSLGSGATTYIHEQTVPAPEWVINHNLGYRPDFTFFTVGGMQFQAGVLHPTLNQTLVSLGIALAGEAHGR